MITNKDISIDNENGKITLNGNKYDLGTQGEIDTAVKDIYSVMGQMGAKNLIPYPFHETTKTVNGVTFTDNGDGTITVSGTASADVVFGIRNVWSASDLVELLPNTIYAFSGCPVGGSGSTYLIQFVNEESDMSNKSWFEDIGAGGTITTTDIKRFVGARIAINSGTAFSTPVTFKPMLRLASDTDNTYQPYAMTNKQLTEQVATKQDTLTFDSTPTDASTNPVTSAGIKTYVDNATNFSTETGTNALLQRFGKLRILNSNRCTYADLKTFYNGLPSTDKPATLRFNVMIRTSSDNKHMTTPFVYVGSTSLAAMHFSAYNADGVEGQIGDTDRLIGEIVYTVD